MDDRTAQQQSDPKRTAAMKAVEYIKDGMTIALGTGSTAYWAIQGIAEKVRQGYRVKAIASSKASEQLARESGIELVDAGNIKQMDIGIDGADEVDPAGYLIKGGGGALVREKILASNCREFIVIVDESKQVKQLGKFPVPVEIIPFAYEFVMERLKALGCKPTIRKKENSIYITDNGNYIADCAFDVIPDPGNLTIQLNTIPGVVDNGIFDKGIVGRVIIGFKTGEVKELGFKGGKDLR
jgi:ribose 5-phosphate isomerase A